MKLCIADPPYLGRAAKWYGQGAKTFHNSHRLRTGGWTSNSDEHPSAKEWDDPDRHRLLVEQMIAEYDGWAIAMVPVNLYDYLQWVPRSTHIAVWHRTNPVPGGGRIGTAWEPVLVSPPPSRRAAVPGDVHWDVLRSDRGRTFVGQKPPAWTRWVLDMLGYDPEEDTVDDLFHGSGAVAAEVAQGVLL